MSASEAIYACVYAKEFPAQAMLRLRPDLRDKPCAVLEGDPPIQHVCSCNAKARSLGVVHGMTRVEMDVFPSAALLRRSQREEAAAKAAMLECAGTFSPSVEDRSTDCVFLCVVDISGTDKLFGSAQILAQALVDRTSAIGIAASIAIAGNVHAAICGAHGMRSKNRIILIPRGDESVALASLPLNVLDLTEEQAETFSLWGIYTLGMLAELPEKALIARMGQEGKRLRRLACGMLPHLFVPAEPVFALEEFMELDAPVELLESLLFLVGAMLEQLGVRASGRVLALTSVTITLSLEGAGTHSRTVRPALPTNDRQLWIKLLHLDLEAHPPGAAILAIRLTAEPGSTSKVQLGLFSPQLPEPSRLGVTLARVRAIVGDDGVGSPILKDTHHPDSFRLRPFAVCSATPPVLTPDRSVAAMRRLRPSEDLAVTLRGSHPATFVFRGKRYDIERAYGPWFVEGDWWAEERWCIQQWDLIARSAGESMLYCCVVRDLVRSTWQMVALYD